MQVNLVQLLFFSALLLCVALNAQLSTLHLCEYFTWYRVNPQLLACFFNKQGLKNLLRMFMKPSHPTLFYDFYKYPFNVSDCMRADW